jgi:hypothetical protein
VAKLEILSGKYYLKGSVNKDCEGEGEDLQSLYEILLEQKKNYKPQVLFNIAKEKNSFSLISRNLGCFTIYLE